MAVSRTVRNGRWRRRFNTSVPFGLGETSYPLGSNPYEHGTHDHAEWGHGFRCARYRDRYRRKRLRMLGDYTAWPVDLSRIYRKEAT